jgi:diacylglycerol kinase family enzyme
MRSGRLTSLRDVHHHRGNRVSVETTSEFNVDGELRELAPATFTLLAGGVEVVVG